eukprot:TRINITY_DN42053_c0_g1_i1.p1 TRINITY_DN42053_c0_g1~~TRINITY_DN42053_c0_g1_i1.p1  ORF type:complete len:303 (-),score=65.56 TRINITY_DN42053_c0_g1_i1:39-947(-)
MIVLLWLVLATCARGDDACGSAENLTVDALAVTSAGRQLDRAVADKLEECGAVILRHGAPRAAVEAAAAAARNFEVGIAPALTTLTAEDLKIRGLHVDFWQKLRGDGRWEWAVPEEDALNDRYLVAPAWLPGALRAYFGVKDVHLADATCITTPPEAAKQDLHVDRSGFRRSSVFVQWALVPVRAPSTGGLLLCGSSDPGAVSIRDEVDKDMCPNGRRPVLCAAELGDACLYDAALWHAGDSSEAADSQARKLAYGYQPGLKAPKPADSARKKGKKRMREVFDAVLAEMDGGAELRSPAGEL